MQHKGLTFFALPTSQETGCQRLHDGFPQSPATSTFQLLRVGVRFVSASTLQRDRRGSFSNFRWLTDEERSKVTEEMQDSKVYRLRSRREVFLHHGFTEGCQGCKALLAGSPARGHSGLCRARMEKEIEKDSNGKARKAGGRTFT